MNVTGLDDKNGGLFDGRYRIVGRLGHGGMAKVLLAEDESLHRKVALKILDERYADDASFLERFDREARSAAGLNHPNIVQIYDRGEAQGQRYIAMEYLEGETLKALIQREGPLPWRRSIDLILQILAALRFAHKNGIVHRDVKPQNVLVLRDGRVKVADFGIARAASSTQMTEAGAIIGTAQYLAPEQARGQQTGPPADLYSAGVVLYEMLTARVPFDGDSAVAVAMKHLSERAVPVEQLNPTVPHDLARVVARAMAKDPQARYQTADEMGIDLDRVRKGVALGGEARRSSDTAYIAPSETGATRMIGAPPVGPPLSQRHDDLDDGGGGGARSWAIAFVLAAAIVGLAVAAFLLLGGGGGGDDGKRDSTAAESTATTDDATTATEDVRIPTRIKGLTEAEARALLTDLDLDVDVRRQFSSQVPEGLVITSKPEPGSDVPPGSVVQLVVSRGQQLVEIADVVGNTFDDAKGVLEQQGFEVRRIDQPSSDAPAGEVLAQSPGAGEQRPKGATVTLRVSTGPEPVKVPPLVGEDEDTARADLEDAGLVIDVERRNDEDVPAGTVIATDPAGGTEVPPGSTVVVVISDGPARETVPDVREQTIEDAVATLDALGFDVQQEEATTDDPTLDGIVADQDPPPRTEIPVGATVTLTVWVLEQLPDTTDTGAATT